MLLLEILFNGFLVFLKLHWLDLIVVFLFVGVLAFLWKRGKKQLVMDIIRELVCRAEQIYGSGTAPIKLANVWANIYIKLPFVVRIFFTQQQLQGYIEESVDWLRKKLAINSNYLSSYSEEKKQ